MCCMEAGSKAIVTDAFPTGGGLNGWDHVIGTSFYIHLLSNCTGVEGNDC